MAKKKVQKFFAWLLDEPREETEDVGTTKPFGRNLPTAVDTANVEGIEIRSPGDRVFSRGRRNRSKMMSER